MARTARTPTTTPAAIPATLVLDLWSAVGVAPASEACAAGWVTTTVWPGAMLVTTDGVAVVEDALVDAGGADEVNGLLEDATDDSVGELADALDTVPPPDWATLFSVPVR
jgi:hypothetical protein